MQEIAASSRVDAENSGTVVTRRHLIVKKFNKCRGHTRKPDDPTFWHAW
jgi:hypothetical protein